MRKVHLALALSAVLSCSTVFADDMTSDSKACSAIATACLNAGYTQSDTSDKQFWKNCMKPVVLGKTVEGITVDSSTVKACRTDKIAQLKQELKEFQNVKKS